MTQLLDYVMWDGVSHEHNFPFNFGIPCPTGSAHIVYCGLFNKHQP